MLGGSKQVPWKHACNTGRQQGQRASIPHSASMVCYAATSPGLGWGSSGSAAGHSRTQAPYLRGSRRAGGRVEHWQSHKGEFCVEGCRKPRGRAVPCGGMAPTAKAHAARSHNLVKKNFSRHTHTCRFGKGIWSAQTTSIQTAWHATKSSLFCSVINDVSRPQAKCTCLILQRYFIVAFSWGTRECNVAPFKAEMMQNIWTIFKENK